MLPTRGPENRNLGVYMEIPIRMLTSPPERERENYFPNLKESSLRRKREGPQIMTLTFKVCLLNQLPDFFFP